MAQRNKEEHLLKRPTVPAAVARHLAQVNREKPTVAPLHHLQVLVLLDMPRSDALEGPLYVAAYAVEHFARPMVHFTFFHSQPEWLRFTPESLGKSPAADMLQVQEEMHAKGKARLEHTLEPCIKRIQSKYHGTVEVLLAEGDPRASVEDMAVELRCDVLVMGTRGLGVARRVVLGSCADFVLAHLTCPIVVVPTGHSPKLSVREERRVGVCLERNTDKILWHHYARKFRLHGETIVFMHVCSRPQESAKSHLREVVQEILSDTPAEGHEIDVVVIEHGLSSVGEAIATEAERRGLNLIVMGKRPMGVLKRAVVGSVARTTIHHTKIPVLVYQESTYEKLRIWDHDESR